LGKSEKCKKWRGKLHRLIQKYLKKRERGIHKGKKKKYRVAVSAGRRGNVEKE